MKNVNTNVEISLSIHIPVISLSPHLSVRFTKGFKCFLPIVNLHLLLSLFPTFKLFVFFERGFLRVWEANGCIDWQVLVIIWKRCAIIAACFPHLKWQFISNQVLLNIHTCNAFYVHVLLWKERRAIDCVIFLLCLSLFMRWKNSQCMYSWHCGVLTRCCCFWHSFSLSTGVCRWASLHAVLCY